MRAGRPWNRASFWTSARFSGNHDCGDAVDDSRRITLTMTRTTQGVLPDVRQAQVGEGSMPLSAMFDTAIGLVLMYVILSLGCTVINEYVATWMKLRATMLEESLRKLIDVPNLQADFYNHGLVDGPRSGQRPHASYMAGATFAMALLGSLDPTKPLPGFADVRSSVEHLPDSNIRDTLLTQISAAQGDLEKLRGNIAGWFDDAMARLSGVYKRYLKWLSLAVGLGLAVVINGDTFDVATALWHDDALRAQMVSLGSKVIDETPPAATTATTNAPDVSGAEVVAKLQRAEVELRPLPLGWTMSPSFWERSWWLVCWAVIVKLTGILVTALALSLGAPFWFDVLSKFMNIRGTGPKPAPSNTVAPTGAS
jgi:hypothetical protein